MKHIKHRFEEFLAVFMRADFKITHDLESLKSIHDSEKLATLIKDSQLIFSDVHNTLREKKKNSNK